VSAKLKPDQRAVSAAPKRLPAQLLTKIEIRDQGQGRQLVFSGDRGEVASIGLDAVQLHWFVGRLATHSHNAGWGNPIPVPGWLEPSTSTGPVPGQHPARSVH
jgi:hypothetical protein